MSLPTSTLALAVGLLVGMLLCLEFGYRVGRRATQGDEAAHEGLGAIEAAIFALLGLLLGFAFAGAMARLDARRALIVQEANAIGTAYLRLDVLPPADQLELRRLFREYLDVRARAYDALARMDPTDRAITRAEQLQRDIWARAVASTQRDPRQNTALVVLPALNEMIDVTTARSVAVRTALPTPILTLLVVVALLSALIAGFAMAGRRHRSPLHVALYTVAVAVTVYMVLDLDNPRVGLIRLDATEQILEQLRESIRQ